MSAPELTAAMAPTTAVVGPDAPPRRRRGAFGRLLRSELRLLFGRRRNLILLLLLAAVPLVVGIVIKVDGPGGGRSDGGPQFLDQVTGNGLFLVFTAFAVTIGFFLPLVIAVVSGDAIAGEASAGTLRYLLLVPVGRVRVLLAKLGASLAYAAAAVVAVALVGLATGAALFPLGRVTLLSGDTVSLADGIGRAALIVGYLFLSLAGLVVVGLFLSTLTEVGVAAMVSTLVVPIICEILDAIPQVRVIHPYLLTHHWTDFGELLRTNPSAHLLVAGLAVQLGWALVAGALAYVRFTTVDVTS